MIEVNLYSITTGNTNATVGRCVDRVRFDKEALGVGVLEFVKGFLKNHISDIELALKNADIINFLNSNYTMKIKDFVSINYYLARAGYMVQIQNVTDDEENPTSVPAETVEWNVIDTTFLQYDYPTTVKIIPADGMDIVEVLKKIVEQVDFFDPETIGNVKNPLKEYVERLEQVKRIKGSIEPGITTRIYEILDQLGIKIFCATGE